jgi:type II secretory pathway component PulF
MSSASLPQFLALNEQLAALAAAGVPLEAAAGRASLAAPITLEEINAAVTHRVATGETVNEAIESEPRLPPAYRCLVEVALRTHNPVTTFHGPQRIALSNARSWYALKLALVYPLVLAVIAYAGLILLCLTLIPELESFYVLLQLPQDATIRFLIGLKNTLPYWVAVPPVLLLILGLIVRVNYPARTRARGELPTVTPLPRWIPGIGSIALRQECSRFAESLANLLQSGLELPAALPLAIDVCADAGLRRDLKLFMATMPAPGEAPPPASGELTFAVLPPFLQWALLHSGPLLSREQALRLAADTYFHDAEQSSERLRFTMPMVTSLVLGGAIVLLYGLLLFLPVTNLLWTIAS